MSNVLEPAVNDIWTVPEEESLLAGFQAEDAEAFSKSDATTYYHRLQDADFLQAIIEGREPAVTGEEGRKVVEIITAIYRSSTEGRPVQLPL
jgi:predicted dehydrogenase